MNKNKDIHELIDDIVLAQAKWTKEERLRYFASTFYPQPIDFIQEVDGTKYIVRAFFDKDASESVQEKIKRIVSKK